MKKTVLAVLVAVMAMSSGITAFAYWKSELKVKANIPVVYDVDIEVSGDVKGQEKVGVPDQGKKSASESAQEESTANTEEQTTKESIQNKPSIEETSAKESITKTENNTESKAEADTDNEEIKR